MHPAISPCRSDDGHVARILIAEPSPDVRELYAIFVQRLGHEVVHDLRSEVDLMILEPAVPENLKRATGLKKRRPHAAFVCTSIEPPSGHVASLAPTAYLVKPFPLVELADAVDAALEAALEAAA
jgi:DNA-binding response OmpR family regulator